MFSSDSFIQLAFANENDTYYCENLMKLNLQQYLWRELHRNDYQAVYFLRKKDERLIAESFGDHGIVPFSGQSGGFFKVLIPYEKQFVSWMKARLTDKEQKAAFVCSLSDFCEIFQTKPWKNELQQLSGLSGRKGTIVLTVPPVVEHSRRKLLCSPVFEMLQDPVILNVRQGNIRNLYSSLKNGKAESCEFLNTFTRDRLRSMLLHAAMEKEEFYEDALLDLMADYLAQLLHNRQLQWKCSPFHPDFHSDTATFTELYYQLRDPKVWKRLLDTMQQIQEAGSISTYVRAQGADYRQDDGMGTTRISHQKGSFACNCMALRPQKLSDPDDALKRSPEEMLMEICYELSVHQNKEENAQVTQFISECLKDLGNVCHKGDGGTYQRVLYAIHFGVQCLYAPEQDTEEIKKILGALNHYIRLSESTFDARCNYERMSEKAASGLGESILLHLRTQYLAQKKALATFDSGIESRLLHYSAGQQSVDNFQEIASELHGMLDTLEKNLSSEPQEDTKPQPAPAPLQEAPAPLQEDEDDEDLFITDAMFGNAPI